MRSVNTVDITAIDDLEELLNQPVEPLLIKNIAKQWPVITQCVSDKSELREYLNRFYQPMLVGTGTIPEQHRGRLFYNEDFSGFNFSRTSIEFTEFLDALFNSAELNAPNTHYMGSTNVNRLLPGFRADNDISELKAKNPLVSIWMSNRAKVAAHQDFPDNLAICVAGRRRFTLFPPNQVHNLYIGPVDLTPAGQPISLVNHSEPDLTAHPKYESAMQHAMLAELEPSDGLLIPSLWWHAVEGLDEINVLINYWWQDSPNYLGSPMDALLHSIMNIKQLPAGQKVAMADLFKHYVFTDEQHNHIPEQALGILASDNELAVRKLRSLLLNKLNQ